MAELPQCSIYQNPDIALGLTGSARHVEFPSFSREGTAMNRRMPGRRILPRLAAILILSGGLIPLSATSASAYPPAGWFQLRTTVRDQIGSVRAMDVLSETFQVDGTIRLNGPSITDQQRWKVLLVSGDIGDVKLENKLTGQCISYANTVHPVIVLTPCNGPQTVFESVAVGGGWVFQSKEEFSDLPPFPGFKVCLEAEPGFGPHFGHVLMQACDVGAPYTALETWNAVPIPSD